MTGPEIRLLPPDDRAFAPFGRFVTAPAAVGTRNFYSDTLEVRPADSALALHANRLEPRTFPLVLSEVERHPHASQCFFPLDVGRFAVVVMPSDADGNPVPDRALGFAVPGTMGVIYHAGVWHMGATAMDRAGHFVVLMWRGGAGPDDVGMPISPITLTDTA